MGGPQNYRQPPSRHASHSLALRSVGGGVQAGAGRCSGRHNLWVQRGVVGSGDRVELGAAEAGRPQLGGAHRRKPLQGWSSGRSQGPGPSQHGECRAPSPGVPAGTCELRSPRRLTRRAAWRGGLGKPPMDACGKRPDPPLLACRRAEQRLKILALRSHGGSGGSSARGCPAPTAAATREDPTPLKASELGVQPAPGRESLG